VNNGMGNIAAERRELTRHEKAAIKKLVTDMCANYDKQHGCLPLDCDCYMFGKCWTGSYCKYFQKAVLPFDPMLEASLLNNKPPAQDICTICKKPFITDGKQSYCSAVCKADGNRQKSRERMRKKRRKT